jgi:hypothetical protein
MAQRDADNLISKLRAMGEEGISTFYFPSTPLRSASGAAAPRRCAPPSGLTSNCFELLW